MPPKSLIPKFWRRAKEEERPEPANPKEVIVNKTSAPSAEAGKTHAEEMLSYEDIYHAAGIMSPPSGYSIQKVVEMLNSERIRELSKEIKRASILMALDAAGTSVDEVLKDATRRQEALNSYEGGKKKQTEDFEAAKSRENGQIEQEMERVRAHYAERIDRNRDLVTEEKEKLRNWQTAMQHEIRRIAEVIELCSQQAAPAAAKEASKMSPEISVGQARAVGSGQTS